MTDSSRIEVRLLRPADAFLYKGIRLEALSLSPEAFASTFEHEGSQSLGHFEEALTKADVFGAFRGTHLVGVAGYSTQAGAKQAHKGSLWGMYVCPPERRNGVARSLVEAVVGHARDRVELLQLSVVSDNEAARRLYDSFGFVAYGQEARALKQDGRYYDGVHMVVALHPVAG